MPKELRLVMPCDLPGRFPLAPRGNLHLVVAGVGIRLQVADVGDVHDVPDPIAEQLKRASKHILEHIRPQIADVGHVIDRRPAAIHPNLHRIGRSEGFDPARAGIEKLQKHLCSPDPRTLTPGGSPSYGGSGELS